LKARTKHPQFRIRTWKIESNNWEQDRKMACKESDTRFVTCLTKTNRDERIWIVVASTMSQWHQPPITYHLEVTIIFVMLIQWKIVMDNDKV
jgi:hypothetical protein